MSIQEDCTSFLAVVWRFRNNTPVDSDVENFKILFDKITSSDEELAIDRETIIRGRRDSRYTVENVRWIYGNLTAYKNRLEQQNFSEEEIRNVVENISQALNW